MCFTSLSPYLSISSLASHILNIPESPLLVRHWLNHHPLLEACGNSLAMDFCPDAPAGVQNDDINWKWALFRCGDSPFVTEPTILCVPHGSPRHLVHKEEGASWFESLTHPHPTQSYFWVLEYVENDQVKWGKQPIKSIANQLHSNIEGRRIMPSKVLLDTHGRMVWSHLEVFCLYLR